MISNFSLLIVCAAVATTILLGAALLFSQILRQSSAASRFRIYSLAVFGSLFFPIVLISFPRSADVPIRKEGGRLARQIPLDLPPVTNFEATLPTVVMNDSPETVTPTVLPEIVWLVGFVLVGFHFARSIWGSRRLVRRSVVTEIDGIREIATQFGLRRKIRVAVHPTISVPMVVGLLRPRILLPEHWSKWTEPQRRSVFVHEMAHIARADLFWHFLTKAACAVYWFHPLVWRVNRNMRIERELACDDAVLYYGVKGSDYAETLVLVANSLSGHTAALGIAMSQTHKIESRIDAILDPTVQRKPLKKRNTMLLFLALSVAVGGIAMVSPVPKGIAQCIKGKEAVGESEASDRDILDNLAREKKAFEKSVKAQQKNIQHLMRQAAEGSFRQNESIVKDYILAEAKLEALQARYEAAKAFNPTIKAIPEVLFQEAIQSDLDYKRNEKTLAMIRERIETALAENHDDTILAQLREGLSKIENKQDALEKHLRETKGNEILDQLKLAVQQSLWAQEAEIESQKILVAKLKEKVTQQKEEADEYNLDQATNAFPWNQVRLNEQVKLARLKAELAVAKQELEETVEYSEEEIAEMLEKDERYVQARLRHSALISTGGVDKATVDAEFDELSKRLITEIPKQAEGARKLALRKEIREMERTIRVSEAMLEELKK